MNLVKTIDVLLARVGRRAALLVPAACGLLYTGGAAAQNCEADADCGSGYVCEVSTGGGCSVGPCTPDGVCPPPVCETFEYRYCSAAPCVADADCPGSMVCQTESWQECSGGGSVACARGEPCDAGPPLEPSCTEHTRSLCVERYNLPCEADADCGPGFECVESISTSCSGGGSVQPDGDGGIIFEPTPSECTSEPSGYYYCKLLELPCAANADCPAGLSCEVDAPTRPCAGGGGTLGGSSEPAIIDCGVPLEPTYSCKPPHYGGGGGGTIGGGTGGGSSGGADGGVEVPGSGTVGGAVGGGSAGGGTVGGTGSGDPGAPDDGEAEEGGHDHGHGPGRLGQLLRRLFGPGGCSVSGAAPAGDLSWLAVAGLLFGVTRRRRS